MWTRKENVLRLQVVYYHITVDVDGMGFDGLLGSKNVLRTNK